MKSLINEFLLESLFRNYKHQISDINPIVSCIYYQYTNKTPDDLILEILLDEDHMPLSELKSDFKVKELIRKYFSDRY